MTRARTGRTDGLSLGRRLWMDHCKVATMPGAGLIPLRMDFSEGRKYHHHSRLSEVCPNWSKKASSADWPPLSLPTWSDTRG